MAKNNVQSLDYTIDELMAVCISRQVQDGEVWAQGLNTPLVMAGIILAKCNHAPNIRFTSAIGQGLCQDWSPLSIGHIEDLWLKNSLLHVGFASAIGDLLPAYQPKEFFRPAQVDPQGNSNNIAFGKDYNKPRMRLPGTGGIPDVTVYYDHVYLYVPRHSRIIFPKQIDFVSGLGHVEHRKQGAGVHYLISDLGQFDWKNGRMRLISYHHGVSIEHIQKKTGFKLETADTVQETEPPTSEEIQLLREVYRPFASAKIRIVSWQSPKRFIA